MGGRESHLHPNLGCMLAVSRHEAQALDKVCTLASQTQDSIPSKSLGLGTTQGKQVAALPGDEAGEADELSHHPESAPAAATPFKHHGAAQGSSGESKWKAVLLVLVAHHRRPHPDERGFGHAVLLVLGGAALQLACLSTSLLHFRSRS